MDFGLIQDAANPMTRNAKKGATLLSQAMQSKGKKEKDVGVDQVLVEGGQFEQQRLDMEGPASTLSSPYVRALQPPSAKTAQQGYVIISQLSLNEIMCKFGTV